MRIKPFQALKPPVELAAKVASLPYDVVDTAEARQLSEGNPFSFFHVSRAEIALPDGTDLYSEAVYKKAAEVFQEFQRTGVLVKDLEPALYLYRLVRQGHAQIGLITVCHVEDYERDLIKKHEKTRRAPEDDRTKHISMTNSHSGPVFLLYRDSADIDALASAVAEKAPLYDLTAADGVQHTIWRIADTGAWVRAFDKIPRVYIADGHHRAAAAARVARERKAANPRHMGSEEYNWFQAVLFPASQLQILPYNRCVKDLNGLSDELFQEAVSAQFTICEKAAPQPKQPENISMYFRNRWVGLSWTPGPVANPVAALDVSVLQDRLLGPVLGIDDPRSNPRIEFIGGIRGTGELEKQVQFGRAAVAFSMYPTTVDQLMAISDAGEIMPPKSTWFEPKLRDGLIIHTLD